MYSVCSIFAHGISSFACHSVNQGSKEPSGDGLKHVKTLVWLVVTGTWFLWFSIQLGTIIPTDELHHFSEGWRKTTNQ